MSEVDSLTERMSVLVARIANTGKVAIDRHPDTLPTVCELAQAGANALDLARRLLQAESAEAPDIETAVFMMGIANTALEHIVSIARREVPA